MFAGKLTFPPAVNSQRKPEIRHSREVKIEIAVDVARNTTFRRSNAAAAGPSASVAAFVVAALVAAKGLPGGERLVADGALVGPAARVEGGNGGGVGGAVFGAGSG